MCYTYEKSKGGDTRKLQSRMVPPKKTGSSHLKELRDGLRVFRQNNKDHKILQILNAVAIWRVTGQGFQNIKWPAVLYY